MFQVPDQGGQDRLGILSVKVKRKIRKTEALELRIWKTH